MDMGKGQRFDPSVLVSQCRRPLSVGLFVAVCSILTSINLQASSGTEGAAFLDIPVGAGPAALGSAYTALANDAYAPIYNPAGLGFLTAPELSAQHLSYLESINYEFGSFVFPLKAQRSALGASVQYLGTGDINATGPNNAQPLGTYSAHYGAYSLAYGQRITDHLSLGLTGKVVEAKIEAASAMAYAADLGSLYKATDKLNLAATLTNLGNKLTFDSQGDSLPMAFHLGAAYQPERHWKTTVEGVYSKTGLVSGRFGTEWRPMEAVSIRTGYKSDTTKELSALAGLTVGLGLHVFGQEFAYAWLPYGDLGDTQYFSLLLKFGGKDEEKRNLVQFQTIKVDRSAKVMTPEDPEYEQLMQLLTHNEEQIAQSPTAGGPHP